ncbi:cystatin-A-like [Meriones unguiculatus]|uniref:cystatin-A-like n=1 Tax=Meriones unguiculatus TaxID=10047 RepID=UPI00293E612C|nr:cystatin-A-like [Meriones unguiculatus]XP_060226316.1 cystatin-A-like [Meriones unguiculatus]XP_060226317.1 cystatin-A-like [Meriones unguiculatus]XP_060226318.1 cystatin-A-like [Meriones unguiculatus]
MIRGGLSEAKPATPEIQEIVDKIKPQLEEQTNEKYETFKAVEYKSQVVAGINHFIKVDVGGGRYIHVRAFSGINDPGFELSGYQADKTRDDDLTYF